MPYQQNEKSTKNYKRKSWMGSLRRVVTMGKKRSQTVQLQKPQDITLRCISKRLVLVSVNLNSNRKDISIGTRNIIRKAERQILQERVKCINNILQDNREGIASSKSKLFSIVTNQAMQQQCTEFIDKVRETRFNKVRHKQIGKFTRLLNKH